MKKLKILFLIIINTFILYSVVFAEPLYETRKYEPAIFTSQLIPAFTGIPVGEIYAYTYHSSTDTWDMIPFQIDEQTFFWDPVNNLKRWSYFIYPEWADSGIVAHDGIFNDHDELVFLLGDTGDKDPGKHWIDNEDSKNYNRLQLEIYDSGVPDNKSYVYLYRSTTLKNSDIPRTYTFSYNQTNDVISSKNYSVGFNGQGLVDDITLNTPGVTPVDIFDVIKVRFFGILDLAIPIELTMSEESFYLAPDRLITQNPVVRLIRQVKQTIKLGDFIPEDTFFWMKTKFYPNNCSVYGGAKLTPEDLGKLFPDADITLLPKDMRVSWDFNENAVGMKFYNEFNLNIPVDGIMDDTFVPTVNIPTDTSSVKYWNLLSGTKGSVFILGSFEDKRWNSITAYYRDNNNGGQTDQSIFQMDNDTGDNKSFGDSGVLFQKILTDTISLNLGYTAYFLPETNLTQINGLNMARAYKEKVKLRTTLITSVEDAQPVVPQSIQLDQNYPNPFNNSTQISFNLSSPSRVDLTVYDATGRLINKLVSQKYQAGQHKINWNGTDEQGIPLPSGIYFYKLVSENTSLVKKLVLVR